MSTLRISYMSPFTWLIQPCAAFVAFIITCLKFLQNKYLKYFAKTRNYVKLDGENKQKLISIIDTVERKRCDIDKDTKLKMNNFKLESSNLIPMAIELAEKTHAIAKKAEFKQSFGRRKKSVKPEFEMNIAINKHTSTVTPTQEVIQQNPVPNNNVDDPFIPLNMGSITIKEFNDALEGISLGTDSMGMARNILQNCSVKHKTKIINCYNKLLNSKASVDTINFGESYYVYKNAKKGQPDDISSFRSIVSFPLVVRLFHRILMLRLADYFSKNDMIDTVIHKGGVKGVKYGILQQIYKVKNVIKHANIEKKAAAIVFMDISNAFGNIQLESLFNIMKKYKIDDKFITYIRSFYKTFQYTIKTNKWKTDTLDWKNGIVQGCPLSALLFTLAMNYIMDDINKRYIKTHGYNINGTRCLFTTYLDDVCIMSNSSQGLKIVFNELREKLKTIGLSLNLNKCGAMYINTTEGEHALDIVTKKDMTYLGEILQENGNSDKAYTKAITTLRGQMIRLDKTTRLTNEERVKVFNKTSLPFIRTKLASLYNIEKNKKIGIIDYVNYYLSKWGQSEFINVMEDSTNLFKSTNDDIVKIANDINSKDSNINVSNNDLVELKNKKEKLEAFYSEDN